MAVDTGYANRSVPTTRRFYTLAYRDGLRLENGFATVFQALAAEQPYTPLPTTFPAYSLFVAAGYYAVEDFDGATESELVALGISTFQARAALAAFALL